MLCSICQSIDFNNLPALPAHYDGYHQPWNNESGMLAFLSLQARDARKARASGDENLGKAPKFSQPLGLAHHQSIDELKTAAEHCSICRLIERGVAQNLAALKEAEKDKVFAYYQKKREKKGPDHRLWLTKRRGGCDGFMVVSEEVDDPSEVWLLAAAGFCVKDDDPLSSCMAGRVVDEYSESENTFSRALSWVDECNTQHIGKRCLVGDVELPLRVLDVQCDSNPDRVRLHETKGARGKYTALSHVWGADRHLTTTQSNFEAHKEGIAVQDLPKTFQDAVTFTRRLGIRYLWIDSLCIRQDDGPDWERESSKMAFIYSNAYLTLAATGASQDTEGLFLRRLLPQYETFEYTKNGMHGVVHAFLIPRISAASFYYYGNLDSEPLSQRGWALQERMLAPRTLHFASEQLFFECYGHLRSEDGFKMLGRLNSIYEDCKARYMEDDETSDLKSDEKQYRGPSIWYSTLWSYYPRKLTKTSDKLPALSGIARFIEEQTGDKYVAGLWRSTLIEGLIWQAIGTNRGKTSGPTEYRAPSWSWASMDGPFGNLGLGKDRLFQKSEWEDIATIIDCHVKLKGENPYGEVSSGWLKIKAPIEPLTVSEEKESDWETVPHKRVLRMKTRNGSAFGSGCMLDTISDDMAVKLTLSALLLTQSESKDGHTYQALVIAPVDGQRDHYRRVGKMIMDDESLGKCDWMKDNSVGYSTVTLL